MNVSIAESDADLERVSSVLLELRTTFTPGTLISQIRQQRKEGYQIAYVESGGEVLCVAGFVVLTALSKNR